MVITSVSSQEFAQGAQMAIAATSNGPVFITDCGAPTHVLLSFQSYQDLLAQRPSISASIAMRDAADVEFDAPRCNIELRKVDFS
ncbi:type II toxin-antitoxin system Phd/YefM family antitoxin [uncultured Herbaspirillum sp.]|uniref:type II toxin-antitoxin system Phd/YefM family antitoxin n=1 Tax=uncultured Herbaspirillum sp. TaxID=160236 RepID=UPI00260543EE|nr:type II toxin-antitoxin system Phd/YefM family antitoxin [uncultured Herbaspirillum sp.]